jgi:maltose alpha-D-glucosyltransferase/alpha-amylase
VALLRARLADGALDTLPPPALAAARRVIDEGSARLAGVARAAAERAGDDAGCATRHHGDYHLGQVLRTADGTFYIIDFEGEPAKPLEERRARHSPLRDVAGMLRSFAYAAATAAIERPRDADVAARAAQWEHEARAAFLAGYFAPGTGGYLPRERPSADALLTVFELEKAFYELHYELRNRPTWVLIPLAGIARLTHSTPTATT